MKKIVAIAVIAATLFSLSACKIRGNMTPEERESSRVEMSLKIEREYVEGVNETVVRSINTSITTLLTIGMVYILGVASVKQFALPIIIGVVCGTYSSIFVAGPFWAMIKGDK